MGHAQPPDFAIPWWWSAALVAIVTAGAILCNVKG